MTELFCFRVTVDHKGLLSGHPRSYYVQAPTIEDACKLVNEKKYWQHEIIRVDLMGVAMTPDSPKVEG